jgi:hypothetical protein
MPRPRKTPIPNEHASLLEEEIRLLSRYVPGWKIRVGGAWGLVHLVSSTQPKVHLGDSGEYVGIDWTPVPGYGDEIGRLDWSKADVITWRYSDAIPPNSKEDPS